MTSGQIRPPIVDIYSLLRANNAFIVHFSGFGKGAGNPFPRVYYPADLQNVITGGALGGVSCSVIGSADKIGFQPDANATGCIGVVLGLRTPLSLMNASAGDCGSHVNANGTRAANPSPLSIQDLQATLDNRDPDSYNEWVIGDYEVLGIFFADPAYVAEPQSVPQIAGVSSHILGTTANGYRLESLADVIANHPNQRIFRFNAGALEEFVAAGWTPAAHSNIYV